MTSCDLELTAIVTGAVRLWISKCLKGDVLATLPPEMTVVGKVGERVLQGLSGGDITDTIFNPDGKLERGYQRERTEQSQYKRSEDVRGCVGY